MNDNKTNVSTIDIESLRAELANLVVDAKKLNFEIEVIGKQSRENLEQINTKVESSISSIKKLISIIDEAEKKAGDDFDALVLKQVESVA